MREERAQHGKQAASSESYMDHRHILAHNQDPSCKCFYMAAVAAAVAAALAVHPEETVEVVEEMKDAKDRISMQQRVWCYACVALLRREQTGTCSRTGIGHTA